MNQEARAGGNDRNERLMKTSEKIKSKRKSGTREKHCSNRPKPPSWQNFNTVVEEYTQGDEKIITDLCLAEMKEKFEVKVNIRKKIHEVAEKRHRSNIRRTHSMVIDTSDMPEATNLVIPLADSKPYECGLRIQEFDDILYLAENKQRCRDWLNTLESAEFKPHVVPDEEPELQSIGSDTVTCDLELSEDKWDFLISPYPKGKKCREMAGK